MSATLRIASTPVPMPARYFAALSRGVLDASRSADAELTVGICADEATVLGSFQRAGETRRSAPNDPGDLGALLRRGSGGAAASVAPGTVWVVLALTRPSAMVACDAPRIVNRYVRPLLRALTRAGALTHYFGRDWISAGKRPVGLVSFAHDAESGRSLFEAIVGTTTPFTSEERASFMGRLPVATSELAASASAARLTAEIAHAYEGAAKEAGLIVEVADAPGGEALDADARGPGWSAWDAVREEALGLVGAARAADGRIEVGGAMCVARDALAAFERAASDLGESARDADHVGRLVDDHLGGASAALFGVRALATIRDVVVEAASLRGPGVR